MLTSKANTICLLELLRDYSDADHIMKMREIIEKMQSVYNLKIDRRTVYSSIAVLLEMGYDISVFEENNIGYYLRSREFDPTEIQLISDCVYVNSAIPAHQTEQLIKKLQSLLPKNKRSVYNNISVAYTERKTLNKEVFWNIETVGEAITKHKKIEFTYVKYDFNKKLIPRRVKPYIVSPYGFVVSNEKYYLICDCDDHEDRISQFRMDKIKDIKIIKADAIAPPNGFSVSEYCNNAVCMFGGETAIVTLKCDNSMLEYIIDKFGRDVRIVPDQDGKTFIALVKGTIRGIQQWASNYIDTCEVLAPPELRNSIVEFVKNNKYGV